MALLNDGVLHKRACECISFDAVAPIVFLMITIYCLTACLLSLGVMGRACDFILWSCVCVYDIALCGSSV